MDRRAVIVTGQSRFYSFVAGELQKYIERFSGARLEIVGADAAREKPRDVALILVGGPEVNPLVRRAVSDRLVNFDGLKADGFILRSIHLNERAALVVGGNDEPGTMYGAILSQSCQITATIRRLTWRTMLATSA